MAAPARTSDAAVRPGRATAPTTRTIESRAGTAARLRDLWAYRELLTGMVRRELKVKYKGSALGFLWSLLNPLMYLLVFSFVGVVFRMDLPNYGLYLLTGLLGWNLFANSVMQGTGSITGNSSLVNKVYFPRETLPISVVGANLIHFGLQFLILIGFMAIIRWAPAWEYIPLMLLTTVVLVIFTTAMTLIVSSTNVHLRDTQHLSEVLLLGWFWATPIVYSWTLLRSAMEELDLPTWLPLLNPMTDIVLVFQRTLYAQTAPVGPQSGEVIQQLPEQGMEWFARNIAIVGVGSTALLVFAFWLFGRLEVNFAEDL